MFGKISLAMEGNVNLRAMIGCAARFRWALRQFFCRTFQPFCGQTARGYLNSRATSRQDSPESRRLAILAASTITFGRLRRLPFASRGRPEPNLIPENATLLVGDWGFGTAPASESAGLARAGCNKTGTLLQSSSWPSRRNNFRVRRPLGQWSANA